RPPRNREEIKGVWGEKTFPPSRRLGRPPYRAGCCRSAATTAVLMERGSDSSEASERPPRNDRPRQRGSAGGTPSLQRSVVRADGCTSRTTGGMATIRDEMGHCRHNSSTMPVRLGSPSISARGTLRAFVWFYHNQIILIINNKT